MSAARVLFIDDRPEVTAHNKERLESRGYHVAIADNGYAGMKMLERMPADVVLLEYRPGSLDTESTAYMIKRRYPNQLVVLMCPSPDIPQRILWLVDEYAPKSALFEEVIHAIERATTQTARG